MRPTKTTLSAALLAIVLTACGSPNKQQDNNVANIGEGSGTNYELQSVSSLKIIEANGAEQLNGTNLVLPEGAEITILESKMDPKLGAMVRIGIDSDEASDLPSDVWVLASDIPENAMIATEESDYDEDQLDESNSDDSLLDTSVIDNKVKRTKGKKGKSKGKKMTYCYRYVKQYLLQTGQVKVYLPGGSAHNAAAILPKHGFRKTGHTASSAQNGEVCVYRGGNGGNGHIEVKRNGKWWYGYGFKDHPITPRNHPFIGCYKKGK